MADNTDEEPIDSPENTPFENPSEEIISTKDTDTINPNQETENMEVHHHPDIHHKPKKWKEYFLEFLMIFLAVTMGFLAESYREHLADKEKVKQAIVSLVKCLASADVGFMFIAYNLRRLMIIIDKNLLKKFLQELDLLFCEIMAAAKAIIFKICHSLFKQLFAQNIL